MLQLSEQRKKTTIWLFYLHKISLSYSNNMFINIIRIVVGILCNINLNDQ